MTAEVRFFGGGYSVEYTGAMDIVAEEDKVRIEGDFTLQYLGLVVPKDVPYWHGLKPFVVLDLKPREAKG